MMHSHILPCSGESPEHRPWRWRPRKVPSPRPARPRCTPQNWGPARVPPHSANPLPTAGDARFWISLRGLVSRRAQFAPSGCGAALARAPGFPCGELNPHSGDQSLRRNLKKKKKSWRPAARAEREPRRRPRTAGHQAGPRAPAGVRAPRAAGLSASRAQRGGAVPGARRCAPHAVGVAAALPPLGVTGRARRKEARGAAQGAGRRAQRTPARGGGGGGARGSLGTHRRARRSARSPRAGQRGEPRGARPGRAPAGAQDAP